MDKGASKRAGLTGASSDLRPPPLFRSIGPPGLLACLPPHRRLRFILYRSRAVLPARSESSDAQTVTVLQTASCAHTDLCLLDRTDPLSGSSAALDALKPEMASDLHRRTVSGSGALTGLNPLILESPQTQIKRQDTELRSHLNAPATNTGKWRVGQAGLVTSFQTAGDRAIKEKQQQKKSKKHCKVDCAGKQKYVGPSFTEKEDDFKLCEWLQSLDIKDGNAKSSTSTHSQQRWVASRCSEMTPYREPDTAGSHRRDRRPHFLPPIYQGDSLLHVPLLIPENSPPPSPHSNPETSIHTLPVPLLRSLRRKWGTVGSLKKIRKLLM